MSLLRVSIDSVQKNPLEAFEKGRGQPVAVTRGDVVVFYLAPGNALLVDTPVPVPKKTSPVVQDSMNTVEAAELAGVNKSTISRAIASGKLDKPVTRAALAEYFNRPDLLLDPPP